MRFDGCGDGGFNVYKTFFSFNNFYWNIVALQSCVSFVVQQSESAINVYMCVCVCVYNTTSFLDFHPV